MKQYVLILIIMIYIPISFATNDYWHCTTFDNQYHEWIADNYDQLIAINQSFDACKHSSNVPKTCQTSKNNCEQFINNKNTKPMWVCPAFDQSGNRWLSNTYTIREDAAIAANDYCKQKSLKPHSCYVNLITCNNINKK